MSSDDRLKDHERRISAIEASTGELRVQVAKLDVKLDSVTAGQQELKTMLAGRIERDELRHTTLEAHRVEAEGRIAMIRAMLDPRTLLIVSTIVASNCGSDAMLAMADYTEEAPDATD